MSGSIEQNPYDSKRWILWMELLARLDGVQVRRHLPAVDRSLAARPDRGAYQSQLVAHVYARAGEGARAVDAYTSSVLGHLDESPDWAEAAQIYLDATRHLSREDADGFAERLLAIAQRDTGQAPRKVYEQLVMWMAEQSLNSPSVLSRFNALMNSHTTIAGWNRDLVMQAIGLLGRQGRYDEAARWLTTELRRTRRGTDAGYSGWLLEDALLDRAPQSKPRHEEFMRLLPDTVSAWTEPMAWIQSLTTAVTRALDTGAVADPELGERILALATRRQHELNSARAAL